MAEIHVIHCKLDPNGAKRLLAALEEDIASGRDLGPRGAQMRALGHSLEQASLDLRREMERVSLCQTHDADLSAARAELLRMREELLNLADAFARFGAIVKSYPAG